MLRLRDSTLLLYDQVILASARDHIPACMHMHEIFVYVGTYLIHLINEEILS